MTDYDFSVDSRAPTADSTDALTVAETVGNKADAAVTAVGTTASATAYLKGLLNEVATITGTSQIKTAQSSAPAIDEDGGRCYVAVGIIDVDTGEVASANIDISSATTTVEKSTSGGAFSTAGITQPTLAKANGLIELDFDIDATEWQVGDTCKIKVGGVTADDSEASTYQLGPFFWLFEIKEDLDLEATANAIEADTQDIQTKVGAPAGASVSADIAAVQTTADAVETDTQDIQSKIGAPAGASVSADVAAVQATADAVETDTQDLQTKIGAPAGASVSADIATVDTVVDLIASGTIKSGGTAVAVSKSLADAIGHDGTTDLDTGLMGQLQDYVADDAASLYNRLGDPTGGTLTSLTARLGDDGDAGATSGGLHSKVQLLLDTYAATAGTADSGTSTTLVDAALTETDNYYNGGMLVMTSGNNDRIGRTIIGFTASTDTLTVEPAFPNAVAASDAYVIIPADFGFALGGNLANATAATATNSLIDQLFIGSGEQLRNFVGKTGSTPVAAAKSLVDAIGHTGSAFATSGLGNSIWQCEAVTAIGDASVGSTAEENLLDVGADAGTPRYRLESALVNVASLGSNTDIAFRLKAEINGTLTQIGLDVTRSATGAFDLMSLLGVTNIASRHVRVTVVGDNAADDGSVAATFITSKGGN